MSKIQILLVVILIVHQSNSIGIDPSRPGCLSQHCEYQIKDCSRDNNCNTTLRDCSRTRRDEKQSYEDCLKVNYNALRLYQCRKNFCPHDHEALIL